MRLAAARAARGLLPLSQGTTVLDRLTSIAVDRTQPGDLRAVAVEALATLPARTVRPVLDALKDDASPAVRAALVRQGAVTDDPVAGLEDASDGSLPRDPDTLLHLVARAGNDAPLSTLHRLIERVRSKEEEARRDGATTGAPCAAPCTWRSRAGESRGAVRPAGVHRARRRAASRRLPRGALPRRRRLFARPVAAAFVQSSAMPDAEAWRRGWPRPFGRLSRGRDYGAPRRDAAREVPLPRARGCFAQSRVVNTPLRTAPR